MTSLNSTLTTETSSKVSLLWLPYVLIAAVFIVFLGVNFWCYHKRNRERYLRKRDEKRVKDGLYERRKIIALMRTQFQVKMPSTSNNGSVVRSPEVPKGWITPTSVANEEVTPTQNGSAKRQSLRELVEDSFDFADDSDRESHSPYRKLTFVSSVRVPDMSCSVSAQTILISNTDDIGRDKSSVQ